MEHHDICIDMDASEIIPNLWIGNYRTASNKKFIVNNNIGYIINASKELPNFFQSDNDNMAPKYFNIQLEKNRCYTNLINYFLDSSKFINDGLKQRKAILIYSKNGSRAAVIAAAFLINNIGLDYVSSIVYINSIRRCALIKNNCLLNQLYKFYINK
jgi:hypothetical protein